MSGPRSWAAAPGGPRPGRLLPELSGRLPAPGRSAGAATQPTPVAASRRRAEQGNGHPSAPTAASGTNPRRPVRWIRRGNVSQLGSTQRGTALGAELRACGRCASHSWCRTPWLPLPGYSTAPRDRPGGMTALRRSRPGHDNDCGRLPASLDSSRRGPVRRQPTGSVRPGAFAGVAPADLCITSQSYQPVAPPGGRRRVEQSRRRRLGAEHVRHPVPVLAGAAVGPMLSSRTMQR